MTPNNAPITDIVVLETIGALVGSAACFVGIACCCMRKIFNQDTNTQIVLKSDTEESEPLVAMSSRQREKEDIKKDSADKQGNQHVPGKKDDDDNRIIVIE
jgi:hypothetical protein